jgi:ubiquitin-activating enzyme E1
MSLALKIGDFCHKNGIAFITSDVFGVFGNIFCDFGENFTVYDASGENPASSMIASISDVGGQCLVIVEESTKHNLQNGDVVSLSDVEGMPSLNGKEFSVVSVKDAFSFIIDTDASSHGAYIRGGNCNQVKKPITLSFQPLTVSLENPGMINSDITKMHRTGAMHFGFQAVHKFREQKGRLPTPGSADEAEEIFDIASKLEGAAKEAGSFTGDVAENKDIILRLALCCQGHISPTCAFIGGALGQEILKACSGKFTPMQQWFYYDCVEALSDIPLPVEEVQPMGCRYDGQIIVFGKTLQSRIEKLSTFLVGAGAIGCEMLKSWAMMGVACSGGVVHVTDMDRIEKSNLSRQFLFRNKDINSPKSTTAARAAAMMNPAFNVISYENKVAPDTEYLFNDDFFDRLDFVCTALDNVEARLYVDQRCVFYQKPMLDSGTLGTKGSTQIVVPIKTESYGATRDPPEQGIPICTLKSYPNQIEHTLQWARDWFEDVYMQVIADCNKYIASTAFEEDLARQQNMKLDILRKVKDNLLDSKPREYRDCVVWARHIFESLFASNIKQLLYCFPPDHMTSTGVPFWAGTKKCPSPIAFDPVDPLHMEFILSSANLRAKCFGIPQQWDPAYHMSVLPSIAVPTFVPSSMVKIAATDEDAKVIGILRRKFIFIIFN